MRERSTDVWRLLLAAAMFGVLFAVLNWLQGRFDSADHEKATKIVREYRANEAGPTIQEVILSRHPDVKRFELSWSSEIVSSCYGFVRVSAYVPKKKDRPPVTYSFDVDLTDPSIHPTDPKTIEILKALEESTTSTAARSG